MLPHIRANGGNPDDLITTKNCCSHSPLFWPIKEESEGSHVISVPPVAGINRCSATDRASAVSAYTIAFQEKPCHTPTLA